MKYASPVPSSGAKAYVVKSNRAAVHARNRSGVAGVSVNFGRVTSKPWFPEGARARRQCGSIIVVGLCVGLQCFAILLVFWVEVFALRHGVHPPGALAVCAACVAST